MGSCHGGQRRSEPKDGPSQPVGNQAVVAGGQHKQSSHIKTSVPKGVEAVGYPGGTQTDCPRWHDWRRGVGKSQLSWRWNWQGYEDQSTSFCTQPSAKGRLREMWAHPTKEQGYTDRLVTSAFSVSSCFFLFFVPLAQPLSHVAELEGVKSYLQWKKVKTDGFWPTGQSQVLWTRQAAPERVTGHCEATHCQLQWQERGKH